MSAVASLCPTKRGEQEATYQDLSRVRSPSGSIFSIAGKLLNVPPERGVGNPATFRSWAPVAHQGLRRARFAYHVFTLAPISR